MIAWLVIFAAIGLFAFMASLKVDITIDNFKIIGDAIQDYNLVRIRDGLEPCYELYDEEKEFSEALLNPFDWGYKHILPRYRYRLIEPYIRKGA